MRRSDKEVNDIKTIENILLTSKVGIIGMVIDNFAYTVPVNFIYFKKSVFIHSANEGKKIQALKDNDRVSFLTYIEGDIVTNDNPCNATQLFKSVMIEGGVDFIKDVKTKRVIFYEFVKKYYPEVEYLNANYGDFDNYKFKTENSVEVIRISVYGLSCKINA